MGSHWFPINLVLRNELSDWHTTWIETAWEIGVRRPTLFVIFCSTVWMCLLFRRLFLFVTSILVCCLVTSLSIQHTVIGWSEEFPCWWNVSWIRAWAMFMSMLELSRWSWQHYRKNFFVSDPYGVGAQRSVGAVPGGSDAPNPNGGLEYHPGHHLDRCWRLAGDWVIVAWLFWLTWRVCSRR